MGITRVQCSLSFDLWRALSRSNTQKTIINIKCKKLCLLFFWPCIYCLQNANEDRVLYIRWSVWHNEMILKSINIYLEKNENNENSVYVENDLLIIYFCNISYDRFVFALIAKEIFVLIFLHFYQRSMRRLISYSKIWLINNSVMSCIGIIQYRSWVSDKANVIGVKKIYLAAVAIAIRNRKITMNTFL